MKQFAIPLLLIFSLGFCFNKAFAQLHTTPECGNNFNLTWSTYADNVNNYGWAPGSLSNTFTNVDASNVDISIAFTGETNTLGFWAGNTPKVGSQSSYLYKGIDLFTNGFSGQGITCSITFSKPIYALSFDIHHINQYLVNGDKFTITGKNTNGDTIYPDFTSSQSPTYTVDESTGVVNAVSNITAGENPIVGVNFSDSKYISSISILWEDCEDCEPLLPHAMGLGNLSFCTPQTLGFDGIDDYISTAPFLGGNNQLTMMSWIKLNDIIDDIDIMGQPNFKLYIDSDSNLKAFIKTNSGLEIHSTEITDNNIIKDIWQHVALMYDGINGRAKLYLNGNEVWSINDNTLVNTTIYNSADGNANFDFEIGRNPKNSDNYFNGSINEVRVYNQALTENQLRYQISQKIENNNGIVRGTIIPKDIDDLSWNTLLLYYTMDVKDTGYAIDSSGSGRDGLLHNMTSTQDYNAPLPYTTNVLNNGNWDDKNSWAHGNVWDIADSTPAHAIVKIQGEILVNEDINTTGLILNQGATLEVNNNSGIFNSWYVKLDGTMKLKNASQLIQTENSTLDYTSNGIIEKNLKGTADKYTYNYWASPVGKPNNTENNCSYSVKDIFSDIEFISTGYNGSAFPIGIADYWIWKFSNKLSDDYASWQHIRSTGKILPGEGFTMKGPGSGTIHQEQEYVLKGKPNNGDIALKVNAGNDYLVGNPYPSAMDGVRFLLDNKSNISGLGSTNGTLYFWKHWGGGSHIASDYQGGYATFSLSGGIPAASISTLENENSDESEANSIPGRYIPVGQGFYITSETDGNIVFNNGQRVFYTNDDSNSIPFKNKTGKNELSKSNNDQRMKLRLGYKSVNNLKRQLLITIDENATKGVDWGYDSKYIDTQIDDMYWLLNNEKFVIQAIDKITPETTIPLGLHTDVPGLNSISIDKIENPSENIEVYLHDKDLNVFYDLQEANYQTYLPAGAHLNRFEIAFSKSQTLNAIHKEQNDTVKAFYSNEKSCIIINNPLAQTIKSVEMLNILGQSLFNLDTNSKKNYIEYRIPRNIAGNYILNIETDLGKTTKKVFIK